MRYSEALERAKRNRYNLEYIPAELIDYNLAKIAVTQDGYAIRYVPGRLKHLFESEGL